MTAAATILFLACGQSARGVLLTDPATPAAEGAAATVREEAPGQLKNYTSNRDQAQQFLDAHDQKALDDFLTAREAAENQATLREMTSAESEQRVAWLKDLETEIESREPGDVKYFEGAETSPRDEHSPEAQEAYEASSFAKMDNSIMKRTLAAAVKHFGPLTAATFRKVLGLLPAWAETEAEKYIPFEEGGGDIDDGSSLNKVGVNRAQNGAAQATSGRCKTVTVQPQFNLDRYVSAPWYSVIQLPVTYQRANELYCVRAQYLPRGLYPGQLTGRGQGWFLPSYAKNVMTRSLMNYFSIIWGWQIFVSNQANDDSTSGRQRETLGFLCGQRKASLPGYGDPAKLRVAPCFLPPTFGGDYWVIYHNETFRGVGAAIVIGGQPNRRTGNGRLCDYSSANSRTCTGTQCATAPGGRGMWIMSRTPIVEQAFKDELMSILNDKGVDGYQMLDVDHGSTAFQECSYGVNHKQGGEP